VPTCVLLLLLLGRTGFGGRLGPGIRFGGLVGLTDDDGGGGKGRVGLAGIGGTSYMLFEVAVNPWKGLSMNVLWRCKPGPVGVDIFGEISG
jgi:hypothetical protein